MTPPPELPFTFRLAGGAGPLNCMPCHAATLREVQPTPAWYGFDGWPLPVEEIRARLAARPRDEHDGEICEDPACPGWAVFEMEGQIRVRTPAESPDGLHEIERCDICCPEGLTDADLARLPEAQAALALACEAPEPRPVYVTICVVTDAGLRDVVAIVRESIRGADDFTIMDDAIRVSEVAP